MRTKNSIKNISISLISQVVFIIFGFVTRKIFLGNLGAEYLGVNGLLTNVLSMLGLAEMGIGGAIVYSLYKPLAEKNEEKVLGLIQLYKKLYTIIAGIVLVLSLGLYPFLGRLMKESQHVGHMRIIYCIFVGRNIISYLYAYRWSIICADQREYILGRGNLFFQIVVSILKILVLSLYKNYILFLCIDFIVFMIQNIYNGRVVEKYYPYILRKERYSIDEETKSSIEKNVKALFFHKLGAYCVFGTDNLLISYFINVSTVGLYSNYTMLMSQLGAFISPVLGGIGASVGNMIASESQEKSYHIFKVVYFINFLLYSIATTFLFNLVEPFISWWLGEEYILDVLTFYVVMINFYISGMRNAIETFKGRAGIFSQDKYIPLIESAINLGASIILVKYYGLAGIFMGTTISTVLTIFWTAPYMVYKNLFKNYRMREYFNKYFTYAFLTLGISILTEKVINDLFHGKTLGSLVGMGATSILLPGVIYTLLFFRTQEFRYLNNVIKGLMGRFYASPSA